MNKRMVGIGMAVWLVAGGAAWAGDDAAKKAENPEKFKENKAKHVQMLEEKLTCVKAANSQADLKNCHEAQKQRMQNERLARIPEQRKKLDEREKALKEKQGHHPATTP
ncbi:MAG: hypothetical protein HQL93_13370 [Magnetococcales bacterium]|nr:hypothetical protein [Magnetococcales bacterium]